MTTQRRNHRAVVQVVCLAGLLAAWEGIATWRHDVRLFPSPGSVLLVSLPSLGTFSGHAHEGYGDAISVLLWHSWMTIWRIALGVAFGAPSGVACGLAFHWLRGSGRASTVALIVTRSIPLLALIPLFSFWFGGSGVGILAYIAFGVFVVISSDTYEAAANLPPTLLQLATLLGGRGTFLLRTLYLPGIAAQMAGSVRNVIGLSWALSLGAEYVSATSGLGYLTYQSYLYTDMGKLTVLAAVYMALGYLSGELSARLARLAAVPSGLHDEGDFR